MSPYQLRTVATRTSCLLFCAGCYRFFLVVFTKKRCVSARWPRHPSRTSRIYSALGKAAVWLWRTSSDLPKWPPPDNSHVRAPHKCRLSLSLFALLPGWAVTTSWTLVTGIGVVATLLSCVVFLENPGTYPSRRGDFHSQCPSLKLSRTKPAAP